jgi:cytochrome c oxidase subunit II
MRRSAGPRGHDEQMIQTEVRREPSREAGRARRYGLLIAATAAALVVGLVVASAAGADAISPESGPTENARDVDTLYKIVFFIGVGVILLVWGVLFYSLFRYRARRGVTAPQIRGNTPLELAWTGAATGIVTVLAVITLFYLDDIRNPLPSGPAALADARGKFATVDQPPPPGGKGLTIEVGGQQYIWRYRYPNGAVSFHDMVVPKDTTVVLNINSNDVIHSWWIPKLGPKFDAIRGYTNKTWFKATETGTFTGQCAEFCGSGHAVMTAKVIVVEPERYQAWVEQQKRLIAEAQEAVQKQRKRFQDVPTGGT